MTYILRIGQDKRFYREYPPSLLGAAALKGSSPPASFPTLRCTRSRCHNLLATCSSTEERRLSGRETLSTLYESEAYKQSDSITESAPLLSEEKHSPKLYQLLIQVVIAEWRAQDMHDRQETSHWTVCVRKVLPPN